MSLYERITKDFPALFHTNESGNPYVPCGVWAGPGWHDVIYEGLDCVNNYISYYRPVIKIKENEFFFRNYKRFWIPIYNKVYRLLDPHKKDWFELPKKRDPQNFFTNAQVITPEMQLKAKASRRQKLRDKLVEIDKKLRNGRTEYTSGQPLNFRINQIKEKFGSLRIYYSGGNEVVEGIINLTCFRALQICEQSGLPGYMHVNKHGYYKTIAPELAKELGYTEVIK